MSFSALRLSLIKSIWRLSWPIAGANLLLRGATIIDTAMVGRLGGSELAAVAVSQIIIFVALVAIQGLATGGQVMTAFHTGAKHHGRAQATAGAAITSGIIFSLGAMVILPWLSEPLAKLMGASAETVALALDYLYWIWIFIAFRSLLIIMSRIFHGYGDSATPLWVVGGVTVGHVALAYPLIFGAWGFPDWGVAGASFATGVSECAGVMVLWTIGVRRGFLRTDIWRFSHGDLREVIRTGAPTSGERLSMTSMQFAFARIINSVSESAFAAFRVGVDIQAFSFLPGIGLANAATTLVGQSLGAKNQRRAKRSAVLTLLLAAGYMIPMGLSYFFLGDLWFRAFTNDPAVLNHGYVFMKFAAYMQIPLAASMVFSGALRGAGENKWVMYSAMLFGWGVRIPAAFIGTALLGAPVYWAWFTLAGDWTLRSIWMYARFRSDTWRLSPEKIVITRPSDAMPPRQASV